MINPSVQTKNISLWIVFYLFCMTIIFLIR